MVGNSWTSVAAVGTALSAAFLLTACSGADDPPAGTEPGANTPVDASSGLGQALGLVGTGGSDWDRAAGYWADTDHLMALGSATSPSASAAVGVREAERLALAAQPQALLVPPTDATDLEWFEAAPVDELLADTDWGLRLATMGDSPLTYWHGTTAWDTLEPVLSGSDSWELDADSATYAGPNPVWLNQVGVSTTEDGDVVWQDRASSWRETINTSPTLAEAAGPGMLECLAGAHAVSFVIAPTGSSIGDWDGSAYAIAVAVEDPAAPTAWWCGSLPGGAQALAADGGPTPSDLGKSSVTPGTAQALDADTVKVPLEPLDGEPAHTVSNAVLGLAEKTFPGY